MKHFLLIGFLLTACSSLPPTATPPASQRVAPVTAIAVVGSTPTPYEGCFYVWATQDLPALSHRFDQALRTRGQEVSGRAYAYGEDCVFADGHATFSALETDFIVQVRVKDMRDERALGNWIREVMEVVLALPNEEVPGARPGRVDFLFSANEAEGLPLSVPIERYRSGARGLRGAELFRFFHNSP